MILPSQDLGRRHHRSPANHDRMTTPTENRMERAEKGWKASDQEQDRQMDLDLEPLLDIVGSQPVRLVQPRDPRQYYRHSRHHRRRGQIEASFRRSFGNPARLALCRWSLLFELSATK